MVKNFDNKIFFDNEGCYLGRIPTHSNLCEDKSDNSLYFGMVDSSLEPVIKEFFNITHINEFVRDYGIFDGYGKQYRVTGYINDYKQLQIKIWSGDIKHGIRMIFDDFAQKTGAVFNDDYVIYLDFKKKKIWFEKKLIDSNPQEDKETNILNQTIQEAKDKYPSNYEEQEGYILSMLKVRNSNIQEKFKSKLMEEFDGGCAICGLKNKDFLIASHIVPYCACENTRERVDQNNGLLLCVIHDALFDKGMINFNEKGEIIISSKIIGDSNLLKEFNIDRKTRLNKKYLNGNRIDYLKKHNFVK